MGRNERLHIRRGGSMKNWLQKKLFNLLVFLFDQRYFNTFSALEVKYKKLSSSAVTPTKANEDDAGLDLYASRSIQLSPFQHGVVNTDLAFEIPKGWHMQIHTRSSYGKNGLRCHLGVVDSGYRGEVKVIVHNHTNQYVAINKGQKFCQVLFLPVPKLYIEEASELGESERGSGGFGSSGK